MEEDKKPKQYEPIAIANAFISKMDDYKIDRLPTDHPRTLNHMKLQKMVYMAHGWSLATKGISISNERPQMWKYGPVFKSLYDILAVYGMANIYQPIQHSPYHIPDDQVECRHEWNRLINFIWHRYSHLSGECLSELCHSETSAWWKLANLNNFRVKRDMEIPDKDVLDEFNGLTQSFFPHKRKQKFIDLCR